MALALTMRMDAKTLESFASAKLLAILSGLTERTVRTALATLKAEGWIEERNKQRGRDFWLKYRRATFPDRLPEEPAGSRLRRHPEGNSGSRLPENGAGLPANSAGLPGIDDATPCKIPRGSPEAIAADPDQEILKKDPEQDPGVNPGAAAHSPAVAGSAAHQRRARREVIARERAVDEEKRREREEPMTEEALLAQVRMLRAMKWPDERILAKWARRGMRHAHLKAGGGSTP